MVYQPLFFYHPHHYLNCSTVLFTIPINTTSGRLELQPVATAGCKGLGETLYIYIYIYHSIVRIQEPFNRDHLGAFTRLETSGESVISVHSVLLN